MLYNKLRAQSFRVPIENFLEHASLSKPIIPKRPPLPKKPKIRNRKSRAKKAVETTSASGTINATEPPASVVEQNDQGQSQTAVAQPPGKKRKVTEAIPRAMMNKLTVSNHGSTTLVSARKAATHFTPVEIAMLQTALLSLIRAKGGVLDLSTRIDLEYLTYVKTQFPAAPQEIDYRVLNAIFDILEARQDVKRIMISCSSPRGVQFKSALLLPDVDISQNDKVNGLRAELAKELGVVDEATTAVEVVRPSGAGKGMEGEGELVIRKATKRPVMPKALAVQSAKSVPTPAERHPPPMQKTEERTITPQRKSPPKLTKRPNKRKAPVVIVDGTRLP